MSNYYEKYLKYKSKYMQLKNNANSYQIGGGDEMNINIIVDVQNCFMFGGSFKTGNRYGPILGSVETDISADLGQITEILDLLSKKSGYTVLTRDFHPYGHNSIISFGEAENPPNTWTSHCVDRKTVCLRSSIGDNKTYMVKTPSKKQLLKEYIATTKYNTELVRPEYGDIPIVGNEVSSIYFIADKKYTPIVEQIRASFSLSKIQLRRKELFGGNALNLSELMDIKYKDEIEYRGEDVPNISNIANVEEPKPVVQLLKGQYCDHDANSAFNYHSKYSKSAGGEILMSAVKIDKNNSTGLFEYIINALSKERSSGKNITKININVCGNVGNVCVIHTILQGIAMLSQYREFTSLDVKFNFYMMGTRFAPYYVPSVGENLGRFDGRPVEGKDERVGKTFIEMLKDYSLQLINTSFVTEDKPLILGRSFDVYGYDGETLVGTISL
jgi:hypothetical protein